MLQDSRPIVKGGRPRQVSGQDGRWDDAVYAAQMCSEHSAKAVLFSLGIDFPKKHDVSILFVTLSGRADLPKWFTSNVEAIADVLGELASERALAGYGFEDGVDVEYFKDYASDAVKKAKNVLSECSRLVKSFFGGRAKKP